MSTNVTLDELALMNAQLEQTKSLIRTTRQHAITNGILTPEVETDLAIAEHRALMTGRTINRLRNETQYAQ